MPNPGRKRHSNPIIRESWLALGAMIALALTALWIAYLQPAGNIFGMPWAIITIALIFPGALVGVLVFFDRRRISPAEMNSDEDRA